MEDWICAHHSLSTRNQNPIQFINIIEIDNTELGGTGYLEILYGQRREGAWQQLWRSRQRRRRLRFPIATALGVIVTPTFRIFNQVLSLL